MNYNELSKRAYENALRRGFWKDRRSREINLMCILIEISKLVQVESNQSYANLYEYKDSVSEYGIPFCMKAYIEGTVEDEFANISIQLLELAGDLGIDFDRMQPCRYYRAFDKFEFAENGFALCKGLSFESIGIQRRILFGLEYVKNWAKALGIEIEKYINLKMNYNELLS